MQENEERRSSELGRLGFADFVDFVDLSQHVGDPLLGLVDLFAVSLRMELTRLGFEL